MQNKPIWYDTKTGRFAITFILTLFTTALALLVSIITESPWRWILFGAAIVCAILQALYSIHCTALDKARDDRIEYWQGRLGIYKDLFEQAPIQLDEAAEEINKIAKSIINDGVAPGDGWRFRKSAKKICEAIQHLCKLLSVKGDSINVYYVQVMDDKCTKVKMIAKADNQTPELWEQEREVTKDSKAYCDIKMFASGLNKIKYALNSKDVDDLFEYADRPRDSGKIEQFLFIPVVCGDNKIIGMVEILVKKGTQLADTSEQMEEIYKYLQIYLSTFALLTKAEKAAYALPPVG